MADDVATKLEQFFAKYRVRSYKKGQILILSGDEPEYIYRIISGKVKQYDVTYRGDEVIMNVFKPGAFFPMSMAVNNEPSQFIYEAEADIEVSQAPYREVIEFVRSNPDILFDLLSRVYRGVDGLLGRMTHLMSTSAKSRLMYELLTECQRFGIKNENGSCTIKVTEKELGARAGLSRETISREITKLVRLKVIKLQKGEIIIPDRVAFEAAVKKAI